MVSDTSILKMSQIGNTSWHALMSGTISLCEEILVRSESALKEQGHESNADSHISMMSSVARAYAQVYEEHLVARSAYAPIADQTGRIHATEYYVAAAQIHL
jgi:hypothetical protein